MSQESILCCDIYDISMHIFVSVYADLSLAMSVGTYLSKIKKFYGRMSLSIKWNLICLCNLGHEKKTRSQGLMTHLDISDLLKVLAPEEEIGLLPGADQSPPFPETLIGFGRSYDFKEGTGLLPGVDQSRPCPEALIGLERSYDFKEGTDAFPNLSLLIAISHLSKKKFRCVKNRKCVLNCPM